MTTFKPGKGDWRGVDSLGDDPGYVFSFLDLRDLHEAALKDASKLVRLHGDLRIRPGEAHSADVDIADAIVAVAAVYGMDGAAIARNLEEAEAYRPEREALLARINGTQGEA